MNASPSNLPGQSRPQIPDNSDAPRFPDVRSYFQHRRRMERLALFYRKQPLEIPDEQGLPNIRREDLIETKRGTGRSKDMEDIRFLETLAGKI